MATIINAACQFRNIFASNGYFLVMPSLLRIYSNNQTNELITRQKKPHNTKTFFGQTSCCQFLL